MQGQLVLDVADPVGGGAAALLDVDRVQLAFDVLPPELEEFLQLRKFRGEVEFLPDEGLQQRRMIRKAVDDLGRGQPISSSLQLVQGHGTRLSTITLPPQQASPDKGSNATENC